MVDKSGSRKTRKSSSSRSAGRRKTASNRRRRRSRKSSGSWFWSRRLWVFLGSLGFSCLLIGLIFLAWLSRDLPNVDELRNFERPAGIRVYDSKQNLIGSYGHVMGSYTKYEHIPRAMIDALIATEDRRFYEHSGIDPFGIMRAMYHNIMAGGVVQGGSTLTQQLAKNAFLTSERTLIRKLEELILSFWIENHFNKNEIIEIYLNRVYLGGGNYGIDAAAHYYFDKPAIQLNLQESSMLVGLLKAPSRYAPTRDRELALNRTKQVLLNMKDAEQLTTEQTKNAIAQLETSVQFKEEAGTGSRYFADWVVDLIPNHLGHISGDLEVYTTLDPRLQLAAEEKITEWINKETEAKNVSQAALLTMTPQGAVKAMVGGIDYAKSQYNRATQARRQPGSAFKIFVYLAAIEMGYTPDSWVEDKPVRYGSWSPRNYGGNYLGELKLREAFFRSVNTVAVQLAQQAGPDKVVEIARRLGVESSLKPDLSISLGTNEVTMLELTQAFAHMANNGRAVQPHAITKITQKDGTVLYERMKKPRPIVLRDNVMRMMNDMLSDTVMHGTGRRADFGRPAAGKTGTSQNFRDAWFVGFTPQYVTSVWVGNDNNKPMKKVSGGSLPAAIWKEVMRYAHQGLPVKNIPRKFQYYDGQYMDDPNFFGSSLPWKQGQGARSSLPWNGATKNRSRSVPAESQSPANPTPKPDWGEWIKQRFGE